MKNRSTWRSFAAAFRGFKDVLVHERTFRKMFIMALVVTALMFYFPTARNEKVLLFIMIFAVLTLELINSVIERIMDFIHLEHHTEVGNIKDLMASVVLVVSVAAATIGGVVFWPYIF